MPNHNEEYITYRLTKSDQAYEDAKLLAQNESWNSAINRLYYAAFYAVSALLLQKNIKTQTHTGSKSQFGLNFIKTGIMTNEQGRLFANLMVWREKGDYGDMFDFSRETVIPLIVPTGGIYKYCKNAD